MKKMKSSLPNMVIVLVAVAVVTSAALAFVHDITEEPKRMEQKRSLENALQVVMGGKPVCETAVRNVTKTFDGKKHEYEIHELAYRDGAVAGTAVESSEMGFGGALTILVGLDKSGNVLGYVVRQTSETPGLGAKASDWFQKGAKGDIIGKNPLESNFSVTKDGGEVDAITASTITSRAFLKAVRQAAKVVSEEENKK